MQRPLLERLKSRKFLSAVFYTAYVTSIEVFGLPVPFEAYAAIGVALGLYISSEAWTDGKHKD